MSLARGILLRAATAICVTLVAVAANAQALREPLYMIVSAEDAKVNGAGLNLSRRADPGTEVYSGETLESGNGPISFAVCGTSRAQEGVYTLAPHAKVTAQDISSRQVSGLRLVKPIEGCHYSRVRDTPLATTLDDPKTRSPLPPLDDQIARLSVIEQNQIKDELARSQSLLDAPAFALIGHAARAATFEKFGLLDLALSELRLIRATWIGAAWTRDVISRLTETRITQPDLDADNSGGVSVTPLAGVEPTLNGKTFALLIGISRYQNSAIPPLHFADRDAESFRDYLMSARGGALSSQQLQLLLNENATRERIENGIANLVRGKGNRENTLIVFVAAHGTMLCTRASGAIDSTNVACDGQTQQPFILTFDADPSDGKTTGIPMAVFRDLVTARAHDFGRVLVFVDVCHAGRIAALPPQTRLSSQGLASSFEGNSGMLGILMGNSVSRSPDEELTYERLSLGHGIFTYYTLLGLNQDVPPSDGKIYFDDLGQYVFGQVVKATRRKQRPSTFNPESKLIAVDDATKKGIRLDASAVASDAELSRDVIPLAFQSDLVRDFDKAVNRGNLLPGVPGNAFDLAKQLPIPVKSEAANRREIDKLRVALEERGETIVLKYLKGDQVPQVESDFLLGARYFKAALDLAPDAAFDESRYLFCRGRAGLFEKRYQAAEHDLDLSIQIDPGRAYSYNALGIAYLEQIPVGRAAFHDAISAFQVAIRIAPYWAYPRHNLALTYAEAGSFDAAIRQYQQARLLEPAFSYLPYNLGLLFEQIQDFPNARQAFTAALAIAEDDCSAAPAQPCPAAARVHTALGVLNEMSGKTSRAEKEYRLALQADTTQIDARQDLASLWSRSPKTVRAAEQAWRGILVQSPNYIPALIAYSGLLKSSNRLQEALPLYDALVLLRPDYVPAIIDAADIRNRMGDPAHALRMLDEKRTISSGNPGYWLARARAQSALGRFAAAQNDYAEGLRLTTIRSQKDAIRKEMAGLTAGGR